MKEKNKQKTKLGIILFSIFILFSILIIIDYNKFNENSNIKINNKILLNENKLNLEQFKINFSNLPKVHKINLSADEIKMELINGSKTKMYGFNNQFPGPVFRGIVGDRFEINYTNNLNEESSVHWHGLQLPNEMDGVPSITQTSVKPGGNFFYNFTLKNSGIYWYHPHYNTADQIERGLYGYIIVEDSKIKIKSDIDSIYSLDDIRLESNVEISAAGSGHMDTMHGRYGNIMLVNGQINYDLKAKTGDLIRLRLLNTANARFFDFAIEGQKLLVLGEDIGYVEKPYEVDSLTIAPGERYDILIYFNETTNKNIFSLGYKQNLKFGEIKILGKNLNSTQNMKYYDGLKNKILNSNLPNWSDKLNQPANFTMSLQGIGNMMGLKWTINGKSSNDKAEELNLEEGKFYKIKYKNMQNIAHPMHLHGQKFLVLSRNGIQVKEKGFKDTMIVGPSEEVDIGFIATGVGAWVNHCHILEHAEAGMLAVINVK